MLRPLDFVKVKPETLEEIRKSRSLGISLPLMYMGSSDDLKKEERETLDRSGENVGIVTEVSSNGASASVSWLISGTDLKAAWWDESELEVINNLAIVLSNQMAHPFGNNGRQGERVYGISE